jgi:hypothetical protein
MIYVPYPWIQTPKKSYEDHHEIMPDLDHHHHKPPSLSNLTAPNHQDDTACSGLSNDHPSEFPTTNVASNDRPGLMMADDCRSVDTGGSHAHMHPAEYHDLHQPVVKNASMQMLESVKLKDGTMEEENQKMVMATSPKGSNVMMVPTAGRVDEETTC